MRDIVKKAGLYNGCSFHDCGHVEAILGTHNRAPNLYAAMEKNQIGAIHGKLSTISIFKGGLICSTTLDRMNCGIGGKADIAVEDQNVR
jgi:hypothetical protein